MGRRKSSTAGSEHGDADSLGGSVDFGSRTSGGRRGRDASDFEEDLLEVDPFDAAVEQLYEKRATTRESGLSTIVSLLSQFRYDDCAFREDTLTQLFLSSVRKGKETESCLAAKALGLHVITLGASTSSERIYQEAEPLLEPLILTGKNTTTRVAAVETLTMLCFVGSEGVTDTLHTMHTLWRAMLSGSSKAAAAPLVVAALRAWSFLLSTVPSYQLDAHFVETHLGVLARLLHSGDVEVRGAAGEGIALIWQMADLSSLPESPRVGSRGGGGSGSNGSSPNTLAAMATGQLSAALPPRPPPPTAAAAAAATEPTTSCVEGAFGSPIPTAGTHFAAVEAAAAAGEAGGAAAADSAQQQQQEQAAAGQVQQQQQHQNGSSSGGAATAAAAEAAYEQAAEEEEEDNEEEDVNALEDIVERMRDLAKNRGDASRLNKGDRASSRGTFRDLLAIIEGEHVPETKIKLRHGDLLMVTGLLDNIRLNYLRSYLAEAFQSHLQSNELLHEVFRFEPAAEPEERLTPIEKRLFRSKSSTDVRERSEQRRRERATMQSYKHGSLADY